MSTTDGWLTLDLDIVCFILSFSCGYYICKLSHRFRFLLRPVYHEARERSEPFFPWFSKEKKKLFITGRTRTLFGKAIWWWMFLYTTLRKVTCTNLRKNMYVVTPRCAAAAAGVVTAVVLRRSTKEYTHPYSMMNRRLPTAGIEVTPRYHQLRKARLPRILPSLHGL